MNNQNEEREKEIRNNSREVREKMRDLLLKHLEQLKSHIKCYDDRRRISKLKRMVRKIDPDKEVTNGGDRNLCDLLTNKNDVLLQVITSPNCHNVYGIDLYGNKFLQDKELPKIEPNEEKYDNDSDSDSGSL